jgi:hypothetical protein
LNPWGRERSTEIGIFLKNNKLNFLFFQQEKDSLGMFHKIASLLVAEAAFLPKCYYEPGKMFNAWLNASTGDSPLPCQIPHVRYPTTGTRHYHT